MKLQKPTSSLTRKLVLKSHLKAQELLLLIPKWPINLRWRSSLNNQLVECLDFRAQVQFLKAYRQEEEHDSSQ